jgi:UTP--glucose-1-phosphate uridylyltransferase
MVIGKGKRAIEEHFDRSFQLEEQLKAKGRTRELEQIRRISEMADIHFVWQKEIKGLGDAIYCARHHVNNEPFAVLLGDTVIDARVPAVGQLLEVFEKVLNPVVLLEEVDRAKVSCYGVIDGRQTQPGIYEVADFIEKPSVEEAPSNLVVASRYVFTPDIFKYLEQTTPGKGGEIQITDAMRLMVKQRLMYGRKLDGRRCDIGNKEGFVRTNLEFALKDPDLAEPMKAYIKKLAKEL